MTVRGGVRVALGDVNSDDYKDIIAATGAGSSPEIRVYSGRDGLLLGRFLAYPRSFRGGVFVTAADVDGDGRTNIITAPGAGARPEVRVFDDALQLVSSFQAYDPGFRGGVTVGTGLISGKAFPSIVAGAGAAHVPEVAVFAVDFTDTTQSTPEELRWVTVARFLAYEARFRRGMNASSVQTPHGDDVLTGRGVGGLPQVKRFKAVPREEIASFLAFDEDHRGGVTVGGY